MENRNDELKPATAIAEQRQAEFSPAHYQLLGKVPVVDRTGAFPGHS